MTVIINDEGLTETEITYEHTDTLNKETRALDISADQDLNALSDCWDSNAYSHRIFVLADGRGLALPVFCA